MIPILFSPEPSEISISTPPPSTHTPVKQLFSRSGITFMLSNSAVNPMATHYQAYLGFDTVGFSVLKATEASHSHFFRLFLSASCSATPCLPNVNPSKAHCHQGTLTGNHSVTVSYDRIQT